MDPLERRDLIENEENEINVNEDTIEGEKCNKCDKWFRTGWKSREHLHGKHLGKPSIKKTQKKFKIFQTFWTPPLPPLKFGKFQKFWVFSKSAKNT